MIVLVEFLAVLILVGFFLWLAKQITMEPWIAKLIHIVGVGVVVIAVIWLMFALASMFSGIEVPFRLPR